MKCETCLYFYVVDVTNHKSVYEPLMDSMQTVEYKEKRSACGYDPGGVILDNEAPTCHNFTSIEKNKEKK